MSCVWSRRRRRRARGLPARSAGLTLESRQPPAASAPVPCRRCRAARRGVCRPASISRATEMTVPLSCAGFDSDSSSGELSEASRRAPGTADVDTSKNNGLGQAEEQPPQENGVQKHRYVVLRPFSRTFQRVCGGPSAPCPECHMGWLPGGTPHPRCAGFPDVGPLRMGLETRGGAVRDFLHARASGHSGLALRSDVRERAP